MTDPAAPRELTYQERATLQDLYAWSDRLTDDWLGLGERLRCYADAWKAEVDELRGEVERLRSDQPQDQSQDQSICGDDGPITPEECARWLEAQYARHGELEDKAAAQWLRRLCAENARLRKLYHLLARDVIFFSQYDEDTNTWPDCGEFFAPCVRLNDTFAYATADGERLRDDQLDLLIKMDRLFGQSGVIAWAAQVRGSEPLEPYRTENYRAAREWLRVQEKRSE